MLGKDAQPDQRPRFARHLLPAEIITSLALGLAFVPLTSAALGGVRPADAGLASALVNTTQQIGNSLGVALINTIAATATAGYLASHGSSTASRAAGLVHGYATAFVIGAIFLGVSAIVSLVLVRTRRQDIAANDAQDPLTEVAGVI